MTLSVIVPATDAPSSLPECEAALRRSLPAGSELIVQTEPRAAGPAEARNLAAERASGRILVFVDADVVVRPDALALIAARFESDPRLSALFGSYDATPRAPGLVSRFRNLLHHHVHQLSPGPAQTFWAGLGAVRADDFRAVGGFDPERYPAPSIEDVELGVRMRARGLRIELDPAIQGTHLKRWTLRSMVATDVRRRGIPWTRLQLEGAGTGATLNLAPRQLAAMLGAAGFVAAVLAGKPKLSVAATAAMVVPNAALYRLCTRLGGPRLAAASLPLHLLHHLAALASIPAGAGAHLASRR